MEIIMHYPELIRLKCVDILFQEYPFGYTMTKLPIKNPSLFARILRKFRKKPSVGIKHTNTRFIPISLEKNIYTMIYRNQNEDDVKSFWESLSTEEKKPKNSILIKGKSICSVVYKIKENA